MSAGSNEWGVEFELTLKPDVDFDAFLDEFIDDCIESRELAFSGGGGGAKLQGVVELGENDAHLANLAHVAAWFANSASIESYRVGEPVDEWE
jgi:uncharacterized protein YggL (DUF469 family)